jgi:hypothetical protein
MKRDYLFVLLKNQTMQEMKFSAKQIPLRTPMT